MTYNHAFTLGFAMPKSEYEDWQDALRHEKQFVIAALIERLNQLLSDENEFMEALEGFDSYEEMA